MRNYGPLMRGRTHAWDPDTRDWLFEQLESQAAEYNRRRAYHPTAQDVARAFKAASKRPNFLEAACVAVLASLGWWQR